MVVSVTLWPFTHFLVKKYSLSNECFSLLFGASLISLAHNIPHHSPIFITNKDTVTTLPKVAYNEPLRAEQHCTYTSVSCEVSKMTTPLSVVRVCLVNTVFTAGSVPHYLTFDFSLSTLFTPSFNSRCFRRQPCRLWVDSANQSYFMQRIAEILRLIEILCDIEVARKGSLGGYFWPLPSLIEK